MSTQPRPCRDLQRRVPVLSVRGATKLFGAVVALDGVDLDVHAGEVLALLGDNGAGKSTLVKCISGVHKLDAGELRIDGVPVQITSATQARENGIETVYQDLALFDNLNPTANFFAGREMARPALAAHRPALARPARHDPRAPASCSTGCRCGCRTSTPTSP